MPEPANVTVEQLNDLLDELEELASTCEILSQGVRTATDALVTDYLPFPRTLLEALSEVRARFDDIYGRLPEGLRSASGPREVSALLGQLASERETVEVLAQAATLEYIPGLFAPLDNLLHDIEAHRADPTGIDHDWLSAIVALLRLIREYESLTEDQYSDLMELVSKGLGRLFAVAASRGRFRLRQHAPTAEIVTASDALGGDLDLGEVPHDEKKLVATLLSAEVAPPTEPISNAPMDAQELRVAKGDVVEDIEAIEMPPSEPASMAVETSHEPPILPAPIEDRDEDKESEIGSATGTNATEATKAAFSLAIDGVEAPRSSRLGIANSAEMIAVFLQQGEFALAYQMASAIESTGRSPDARYLPWVLRAVTLAPMVLKAEGRIAQSLREAFERFSDEVFKELDDDAAQEVRCLIAAATLRPSVIAPGSGAPDVLARIYPNGELTPVYDLCTVVSEFGKLHIGVELSLLGEAASEQAWLAEFKNYDRKVIEFIDRASHQNNLFAAASFVWKQLTRPGGEIYEVLATARRLNQGSREQLRTALNQYPNRGSLERLIRRMDREKIGRRMGRDIEGTALSQLIMKLEEALDLAHAGLTLESRRPNLRSDFVRKRIVHFVESIHEKSEAAIEALELVKDRMPGRAVLVAAIRDLNDLLCAQQFAAEEPWPEICLAGPLLRAGISLGDMWAVQSSEEILGLGPQSVTATWTGAFRMLCENGDHRATELLLIYCEAARVLSGDELTQLQTERREAIEDCRFKLKKECARYRDVIEDAVRRGIFGDTERADKIQEVVDLELRNEKGELQDFQQAALRLKGIQRLLDERESAERERAIERLAALNPPFEDGRRIRKVIESGNVLAANEYFGMIERGTPLPPEGEPEAAFQSFFPENARTIEDLASKLSPQQIITALKNKKIKSIVGVDLSNVPGTQRDQAAEMLEAWFSLKTRELGDPTLIHRLLAGVGFTVIGVEKAIGQRVSTFDARTEIIADRGRCPVPQFGSQAAGGYRVHLVFGRPTAEDLVASLSGPAANAPLVFYFGRLSELMRRELAAQCRRLQRTVIVIDEVLMLYLCGVRGSRLPVMFACTLPFTHLEPYVTSASFVPVEMFYGRDQETKELTSPNGTCFVYGGRQLGKTALLRDVERGFHYPSEGRVAKWIDLKDKRIGFEREIGDIWSTLADALRRDLEIPGAITKSETFIQHIEKWLGANPRRRIILLLDEADRFLEKDAESDFARTSLLKGVMDRSNRRFKVVFAGLHNVQRMTRLANHPLAHYGRPVCVGPLFDAGDLKQGRALIVEPLQAIGYAFESQDLVTTILSQTNYYPSLIQLYCEELLRHVAVGQRAREKAPPWVITAKHVEDAYRSRNLRRQIHDRFSWTLQLDPRYEVLAYTIAYGYLSEGRTEFPVHWILEQVHVWWRDGFKGLDVEALRTVLEEMVGLGILRLTTGGGYGLRNLNIVQLMGSPGDIQTALFHERELPVSYEPSSYRSHLGGSPIERRSPLTVQQEGEILSTSGLFVAVACNAAGSESVADALTASAAMRDVDTICLTSSDAVVTFLDEIGRSLQRSLVAMVASGCWTPEQISMAAERIARSKYRKTNIAVVFLADPLSAWNLLTRSNRESLEAAGVRFVTSRPWHDAFLGKWLDDRQAPSDRESRLLVRDGTGNWPRLIDQLLAKAPDARLWVATLRDGWRPAAARQMFGIENDLQTAVLRDLAELRSASPSDLIELFAGDPSDAQQVIDWAQIVGLTESDRDGALVLNPTVQRVLLADA
jgi:hypothetical protein